MAQPTYAGAAGYIGENTFALLFDVPLDAANPPNTKSFDVQINGTGTTVTAVAVDSAASAVTLTFTANALTAGDIIEFSYTDPTGGDDVDAIQGTDGADAATFSSSTVVSGGRPGPAAPATPTLQAGSDSGMPGDGITNVTAPVIAGTAGANATVKLYDTDGVTALGSTVADGSGNWTITSSPLAAGSHNLRVTQTDSDLNTSALSAGLALTIDTAAAAPTALGLAAGSDSDSGMIGDGITNAATPTLVGQAEANATVRLYDTDGVTEIGSATADGKGSWSITSSNLVAGMHTLTARQTDVAGNVSDASSGFAFTLDTTGPTGLALSATTVGVAGATSGAAIATASAVDATAITYGFAVGNGTIDADNAKFTFDGNTLTAAQTLAAGAYHIYVKATDAAANDAFQVFTINVVDAPLVTGIERAGAASATVAANAASVAYTVDFNQAVTGVDAADFTVTPTGTASGAIGAVSGSGGSYTVTVDGLKGDGTLRLDVNGSGTGIANLDATALAAGYVAGQAYTLDHTAPLAPAAFTMDGKSDTGISNSDAITSIATPLFSGSGEANATVNLYDTDGTTLLGTTTADGSGNWAIASAPLAAGAHTLTVRQLDAAGNNSAASTGLAVQILASATAPAAPLLAPASDSGIAGDALTNVTTPTLTGTAAPFAAVTLFDTDGVTVLGSASANAAGAWSITASTLSTGPHGLTVKQTDLAGNVSAASAPLLLAVDTVAPEPVPAPVLATASDSGTVGDGITNVASPVISGVAEANATIRLLDTDGSTVLGTTTADGKGAWNVTSAALAPGAHALTVTQTDTAGNLSGASAALNLTIIAAPTPPTTPTTVDGVPVTQQPVTLPGGASGTQTTVPIVTAGRVETTGNAGTADIPLSTSGGATVLLAQIGAGFGLSASGGASQPAGTSLEQLIASIKAVTPGHTAADQGHLTGNGQSFLAQLAADVPLLVETVTPITAAGTSGATLTLTGTSSFDQHTALVIDASGVGAGNTLALNAVDFAALVGAATVVGNTAGQILTGDSAAQSMTVGGDLASAVFAGGGGDTLRVSAAAPATSVAVAPVARVVAAAIGAAGATLLHGGLNSDTAVFAGAQAAYTVDPHDGYVLVTGADGAQATVVNAETLQFADASVTVENRAELTTLAGLYADVLGRQADAAGFEYWGNVQQGGASLGAIALSIASSNESATLGQTFNGDAAHDIGVLYETIFHREQDAGGAAYWLGVMQGGATLAQVAEGFMGSAEIVGHAVAPTGWDFTV